MALQFDCIGTAGGTEPYQNPHLTGAVTASMSSIYKVNSLSFIASSRITFHFLTHSFISTHTNISFFLLSTPLLSSPLSFLLPQGYVHHVVEQKRSLMPNYSNNTKRSWVAVDLGKGRRLMPTRYCIRYAHRHLPLSTLFEVFFSFLVLQYLKFNIVLFCFIRQNIFTYAYMYVCSCV
jgi:hypothetical protein